MKLAFNLLDKGLIPDALIRAGIRRLLRQRLREITPEDSDDSHDQLTQLVESMKASPIALATDTANDQHYEVPAEFFQLVLGRHLKYSCGLWGTGAETLDQAEEAMLSVTAQRAGIENGMQILELGCGWGSLSLWLAERFPNSRILAVSNSEGQRRAIETICRHRGLTNLEIQTADMNDFHTERRFDRIVSVEMFEHMRNYQELLGRAASWLSTGGKLFMHVFCHRNSPYLFEDKGETDWMSRHFFTGGLMPTEGLLERFQDDLDLAQRWQVDGRHYEKTCRAWLARLDARRDECLELFSNVYGAENAERWLNRWRVFFLSCAELFGYRHGSEWYVSHTLWIPRATARRVA
jgi:cyclopropane-fatty-acyl-phospholipid synthase